MSKNVEGNVSTSSGLAVASLVLGIVGICLSIIPIVNNFAFFLGILAAIFGIIALVKKEGKGKASSGAILGILAIVITLALQSYWSKSLDTASKELDKSLGKNTQEILANDADVSFGKFYEEKDKYGFITSELPVTIKNKANETKSYSIQIEAVDSEGKRITTDYISVNNLGAGQSQDFKGFLYVDKDNAEKMKTAKFDIVEASMF